MFLSKIANLWVERGGSLVHFHTNQVFIQLILLSLKRFLNNEAQKTL